MEIYGKWESLKRKGERWNEGVWEREGERKKEHWREEIRKDRGWELHWQEKRVGQTFSRLKLASTLFFSFLFYSISPLPHSPLLRRKTHSLPVPLPLSFSPTLPTFREVGMMVMGMWCWCCFCLLHSLIPLKASFYCIEQSVVWFQHFSPLLTSLTYPTSPSLFQLFSSRTHSTSITIILLHRSARILYNFTYIMNISWRYITGRWRYLHALHLLPLTLHYNFPQPASQHLHPYIESMVDGDCW